MKGKLVFIGHSSRLDGAERCYLESVKALKLYGVEVMAFLPGPGPLCEKLDDEGVTYQFWEFPRWMNKNKLSLFKKIQLFLWQFSLIKKFKNKLLELKPDYVVTNTVVISPFAAIASQKLGIPHFWYIHEFGDEDHNLKFIFGKRVSGKIISRYSERILVNSEIIKKHFKEVIEFDKMRLLHYAVENDEANDNSTADRAVSNGELKMLLLGRMFPKKGQEEALNGLYHLKKKGYSASLTLVGGGKATYKSHLKAVAERLEIQDNIHIVDFTPEPMKYLRETDIVLMCSKKEAFGRVTVEAMKKGKPVVGANGGATPEIISDGVNGKIYESGNPEDLADKIIYFLENRPEITAMGRRAQKWSLENFNYQVHGKKFLKILNEV